MPANMATVARAAAGLTLGFVLTLSTAHVTHGQATLQFSPSGLSLAAGESALVQVNLTNVPSPGLAAFQFDIVFDPTVVQVLNPNEAFRAAGIPPFAPLGGNPACAMVRGTMNCPDPDWFLTSTGRTPVGTDTIDNVHGLVQIAYGTQGAPAPPTGGGTIALIEVMASTASPAFLSFGNPILADNQDPPMTIAVDAQGLSINGGVAPTPTPTNTPTATNTATRTHTPTPTPTLTPAVTNTPGPAVNLGTGVGRPGGIACVPATLNARGAQLARTTNDIGFDSTRFAMGTCNINPLIGAGTTPNKQLTQTALGMGLGQVQIDANANLIPDGVLYACPFNIVAGTPNGMNALSNAPASFGPAGNQIPATGTAGQIIVTTCTGDCNGNNSVSIGEVVACVNMFLGQPFCNPTNPSLGCPVADSTLNGSVSIGEVVQCVNRFLNGC